jgi:AraC family transcriptional regulator
MYQVALKLTDSHFLESTILFSSDFYQIKNWELGSSESVPYNYGYNDCFCFVYVKKGTYIFSISKDDHSMHIGHIILEKPNFEYRLRSSFGACTIFNFTETFYRQFIEAFNLKKNNFFSNPNLISQVISASPDMEYLHYQIVNRSKVACKLEIDNLVFELLNKLVDSFSYNLIQENFQSSLKSNHIITIERAKDYICKNYLTDITLLEIASYSCVSPFHFCRIFKKFTSFSPYQYLLQLRLKHGEMLLKYSSNSIFEIALICGFSSPEHFSTSFKQKYKIKPTSYRRP